MKDFKDIKKSFFRPFYRFSDFLPNQFNLFNFICSHNQVTSGCQIWLDAFGINIRWQVISAIHFASDIANFFIFRFMKAMNCELVCYNFYLKNTSQWILTFNFSKWRYSLFLLRLWLWHNYCRYFFNYKTDWSKKTEKTQNNLFDL